MHLCVEWCTCIYLFYNSIVFYFTSYNQWNCPRPCRCQVPGYVKSPISGSPFGLLCNPKIFQGGILPLGIFKQQGNVFDAVCSWLVSVGHSRFIFAIESSNIFGTSTSNPALSTLLTCTRVFDKMWHFYFLRCHLFAVT